MSDIFTLGSRQNKEYFKLKETLERCLGLRMRFFTNNKYKNLLDSVLITYKDSVVSHVTHKNPKMLLSCIIDAFSDSYIDIYENQYHDVYAYFARPQVFDMPTGIEMHYVKTIHIPKFQTSKELVMKLELSA